MVIFGLILATLVNFTMIKNENYNKCMSEKTNSAYCKDVVKFVEESKETAKKWENR